MPKVKNEISHDLGQEEAIKRLKMACEWGRGISDLQETWEHNFLSFSVSIQGVKISGAVEVTNDALKLEGKIPLIAVPFKSWLPNILRNAIKDRKEQIETIGDVSKDPLILYLHIPKSGGTTLGEFIYNQCQNEQDSDEGLIKNGVLFLGDGFFRENDSSIPIPLQKLLSRNDLRAVIGHFAFGIHDYIEKPFKYVTILRNPVKRVCSLYNYLNISGKTSLEDFAKYPMYREIDNDQTRRITGVNPEIGQINEEHLEIAKANLRRHFSIVGTTERFDETLVLLQRRLNWQKEIPTFPRNVTKKKAVRLSDATIKAIESRNLLDIELHKFAGQLLDEMIAAEGEDLSTLLTSQKTLNSSKIQC